MILRRVVSYISLTFRGKENRLPQSGRRSSVGIATELRAGRSEDRIPVEASFSAPVQTGPGAHPPSCTMGTGSFLGVKCGRSSRCPLTPKKCRGQERVELYFYSPMGRTACTDPQCLYKGALYLYLYLLFTNFNRILTVIETFV